MKRIFVCLMIVLPIIATAHPSRLNRQGCHNDRKNGGYHCHGSARTRNVSFTQQGSDNINSRNSIINTDILNNSNSSRSNSSRSNRNRISEMTGIASVIDGDTIDIHGQRIRLHGIDAPEGRQLCKNAEGRHYRCGQQAAMALDGLIGGKTVSCVAKTTDKYQRIVAVCYKGRVNINQWMVENGHALAYRKYSKDYIAHEAYAQNESLGIWTGSFDPPWDWRKSRSRLRR